MLNSVEGGKDSSVARKRDATRSLGTRPSGIGVHIEPEKSMAKQIRGESSARPTKATWAVLRPPPAAGEPAPACWGESSGPGKSTGRQSGGSAAAQSRHGRG